MSWEYCHFTWNKLCLALRVTDHSEWLFLLQNKVGKNDEHTPDTRPAHGRSPRAIFSPASFSPTVYVKMNYVCNKLWKDQSLLSHFSNASISQIILFLLPLHITLLFVDSATPSSKYRARTNKGDAVCVYGERCKTTDWCTQNTQFQLVIQLSSSQMHANACYMFNQLRDMAHVLDEVVHHVGQEIVNKFSLQEPQAVNLPHQVSNITGD
jgi:hypothetical protein